MGDLQKNLKESLVNFEKTEEDESGKTERSTFTCEICIEPMSSVEKFNDSDKCIHPFCTDCLAKYIQTKIEENVANIKCPALNCNQLLDPLVCQTIISAKLFNKWCDFLGDASLSGFHRCYCPNKYCSALVINECGGAVKKSKCPKCKKYFCFSCKVPWHAGFWCSETRQRRDANDKAFGVLVEKKKWMRCPYCGQVIERIAGCVQVKCRCGLHFCYLCGAKNGCGCGGQPDSPWLSRCFYFVWVLVVVSGFGIVVFLLVYSLMIMSSIKQRASG